MINPTVLAHEEDFCAIVCPSVRLAAGWTSPGASLFANFSLFFIKNCNGSSVKKKKKTELF